MRFSRQSPQSLLAHGKCYPLNDRESRKTSGSEIDFRAIPSYVQLMIAEELKKLMQASHLSRFA